MTTEYYSEPEIATTSSSSAVDAGAVPVITIDSRLTKPEAPTMPTIADDDIVLDASGTIAPCGYSATAARENELESQRPRSLDRLLKKESYQGMTDEEIQMVMDYREQQAALQAQQSAELAAIQEQTAAMQAAWNERAQQARSTFEQAMEALKLDFTKIGGASDDTETKEA